MEDMATWDIITESVEKTETEKATQAGGGGLWEYGTAGETL